MISNVVLYDKVKECPLSRDNEVSETTYPERTHPDYDYFVPYEPIANPKLEKRYYDYKLIETPSGENHPVYPIYKQWLIEHSYTKRSNDDIIQSAENAKRLANMSLIDYDLQFVAQGLIYKKLNNIILTEDEENLMLAYVDLTNRIVQNFIHFDNMKAQILLGQEPNIDAGWEHK